MLKGNQMENKWKTCQPPCVRQVCQCKWQNHLLCINVLQLFWCAQCNQLISAAGHAFMAGRHMDGPKKKKKKATRQIEGKLKFSVICHHQMGQSKSLNCLFPSWCDLMCSAAAKCKMNEKIIIAFPRFPSFVCSWVNGKNHSTVMAPNGYFHGTLYAFYI